MSVLAYLGFKFLSVGLKGYGKMLKVSLTFEEALGSLSMACWLELEGANRDLMEMYLNFYEKGLKALSYYIMIPAIFEIADDEIRRDPFLKSFFYSWDQYTGTIDILQTVPKNYGWQEEQEEVGKYFEGLTPLNADIEKGRQPGFNLFGFVFSMIVKFFEIANQSAFSPVTFIDNVISVFNLDVEKMGEMRLPAIAWRTVRPTLPFDINLLFAHVRAFEFYKQRHHENISKKQQNIIGAGWKYDSYVNDEKQKTAKIDEKGVLKQEINLNERSIEAGDHVIFNLKGLEKVVPIVDIPIRIYWNVEDFWIEWGDEKQFRLRGATGEPYFYAEFEQNPDRENPLWDDPRLKLYPDVDSGVVGIEIVAMWTGADLDVYLGDKVLWEAKEIEEPFQEGDLPPKTYYKEIPSYWIDL